MSYGRSKLLSGTDLPGAIPTLRSVIGPLPAAHPIQNQDGALEVVALEVRGVRQDEQEELARLRVMNARLLRQLAVLKLRETEALRLADRDGLTGLYNRRRILELLNDTIADAARDRQYVGLLFVDLNGFKAVNDLHGHAAGDKILNTVAARISARVRTGDFVARYGGDEFVVVLPRLPDAASLTRIADAVRDRVALPYWLKGQDQHLSAAVGESIYPRDGVDGAALLHRADQAMYRLKARCERASAGVGVLRALQRRRDDKSKASGGEL